MKSKTAMKIAIAALCLSASAWAAPLNSSAQAVIPVDVHQIISVDYLSFRASDAAMAWKAQALPNNLKEFETAIKSVGVQPDKEVESLAFASFDSGKQELVMIGVISGSFSSKAVLKQLQSQKMAPTKYRNSDLYAVSKTMSMTILDANTLMFGPDAALRIALGVRSGATSNVDSNPQMVDLIDSVKKAPVWSVLDRQGTQNMLLAALGDPTKLPDFEGVKQRVVGSHYTMSLKDGVEFRVDILAQDTETTNLLSSLLKAGVLYKKVTGTPAQRAALEDTTVASDRSDLKIQFKADPKEFRNLLQSKCFAAMSTERKELSGITSAPLKADDETDK